MMTKFNRNYKILIQTNQGNSVEIEYPITITFNITRSTLASANTANFVIYNLGPQTRRLIYQDRLDVATMRGITFTAGYGDDLSVAFSGEIRQAYSNRTGTDWHTEIEAFDGANAIMNGFSSITRPAGEPKSNIIRTLISDLTGVNGSVVGDFSDTTTRGTAIMGNTWSVINSMIGKEGQAFIDNGKAIVKKHNEYIAGELSVVNADTGLLETPRRQDARLDVKVLFEPKITVGQVITLQSIEPVYNGQYEVVGFNHSGTISGAIGGSCVTTLYLWLGDKLLTLIQ
jgi:hypothetical protein